jgi:hypothetical protein
MQADLEMPLNLFFLSLLHLAAAQSKLTDWLFFMLTIPFHHK